MKKEVEYYKHLSNITSILGIAFLGLMGSLVKDYVSSGDFRVAYYELRLFIVYITVVMGSLLLWYSLYLRKEHC